MADRRIQLIVDDRHNHGVVRRLDILFQEGQLGSRAHRGFLTGDELLTERRCRHRIRRMEEAAQVRLVLLADVEVTAQAQKLADRHVDGHRMEGVRRSAHHNETGGFMVGPGSAFVGLEVVQGGVQHREFQNLERRQLNGQNTYLQWTPQAQQGVVDIHLHLILLAQRLEQQRPGEGLDVLKRGQGFIQPVLRDETGR